MKPKILVITILITALIYGSGLDQARSESVKDQAQRVDDQVKKIEKTLKELQQKVKESLNRELPVGTIIPSVLNPSQFFEQLENSEKSKWVLADGNNVVNSKISSVPDLRGMFLRGINEGRDDEKRDPKGNRKPGDYQPDALQEHRHETTALTLNWNDKSTDLGYTSKGSAHAPRARVTKVIAAKADVETRPKNVAVYFYIKIN